MAINNIAMNAYKSALQDANKIVGQKSFEKSDEPGGSHNTFANTIKDSLAKVNGLEEQKAGLIESFASGENQNVHELMISLQKASIAMSMTSAVRGKVMEAYREVMRMQF
ncbi:flagellar hook-basal body complex protein FliE [Oceanidesulfovibrio marinus]|uniref:Flagellar hook-basal body complex protein FliE n=1 Tax=Oceanidesulfovibrio marinus TaxID=370038 RepID=A0A6P1ZB54_9BACT|nr:flagellar hook-basal body complex protein FliE [Oceanidesulfovibrio marinus]QJT10490.1 flagellar hook-basal body complex protein FliE [Oceanidesulfovibrio marinus]TVM30188.1 flagellar hook-basal body complex protein FliE [Oceanidesulfovibrio marinus]